MLYCPRCHRANPVEAAFCHFDGVRLADGAATVVSNRLPHPFVLASGRHCRTYDELVTACQDDWEAARDLLQEGAFRQFLTGAGRLDLAKAAEEARQHPDADLALAGFLGRLPVALEPAQPRLELEPRRLLLGSLRSGETMDVEFRVLNLGRGLLHGNLSVAQGGDWLRIAGDNGGACELKTLRGQVITLHVDTKGLPAPQAYGASLKVITNGGIVEVPVRLNVTAVPFTKAPYQGAAGPRDLAVRMRGNPKPAVALLESGEVSRWFLRNGWAYPVNGPTAKGLAAVQQFFESMGLAKPPPVALAETEVHITCTYPDSAMGQAALQTPERKWVYGRAAGDVPWLTVVSPEFSGPQRATIRFEAASRGLPAGTHEGTIHVIGNAGQTRQLRVCLEVVRPGERGALAPREGLQPLPGSLGGLTPPARQEIRCFQENQTVSPKEGPPSPGLLRVLLAGAMLALFLRLLLALPADLYARGASAQWENPPTGSHFAKPFVLATWWIGAVAGAIVLGKRGNHWADLPCGVLAGAAAGLALSGTVACALPVLDWLPRQLWHCLPIGIGPTPAALGTAAWIATAALGWAVLGSACGLAFAVWRRFSKH